MENKISKSEIQKFLSEYDIQKIDSKSYEKFKDIFTTLFLKLIRETILICEEKKPKKITDKNISDAFKNLFGEKLSDQVSAIILPEKVTLVSKQKMKKMVKEGLNLYVAEQLKISENEILLLNSLMKFLIRVGFVDPLISWNELTVQKTIKISYSDLVKINLVYVAISSEFFVPTLMESRHVGG